MTKKISELPLVPGGVTADTDEYEISRPGPPAASYKAVLGQKMDKPIYDPFEVAADVYARGNHTGSQVFATISDRADGTNGVPGLIFGWGGQSSQTLNAFLTTLLGAGGLTPTDDSGTAIVFDDTTNGTLRFLLSDSAITLTAQADCPAGAEILVIKCGAGLITVAFQAAQGAGNGAGYFVPGDDHGGTKATASFTCAGFVRLRCRSNSDGDSALIEVMDGSGLSLATSSAADHDFADKVVTRPALKDYSEVSPSDTGFGGAETVDFVDGQVVAVTLTSNVSSLAISNPPASGNAGSMTFIINHGTGPYTWAHPSGIKWEGGVAPTLSGGANDVDIITYVTRDAGTTWYGFLGGLDFA